ncbi:hypothetical protein KHA89_16335 [Bacillus sp. FJAT-49731]|uniref:Aerobactin siderophore biosynthesis IucA/IucC-like C-terminal domain-containing protein n=1 Tax=Lederbergia citrea TaxID=2833581 RepID=A0A942URX8_9BACI|nr:hypothetical protein [Lederbergia citrea]MBS4205717.1 hypothetical protein [Lederbergia citrea]MBS4223946.1 hypothetical protein [Lederbergia citrea]
MDDLERLSVFVDRGDAFLSIEDCLNEEGSGLLFNAIQTTTKAPINAVSTSVFMRRYGFFITAQLHLLCVHNLRWTGPLSDIQLIENEDLLQFSIASVHFKEARIEQRREDLFYILNTYGHPIVEYMSRRGKISKLILWENIWGYVLWIYSQLLKDETVKAQADADLDMLLQDDLWKPAMRRSPFKQYIKNESAIDAMDNYKRTTCCLLKEIPGTSKCPYCPLAR